MYVRRVIHYVKNQNASISKIKFCYTHFYSLRVNDANHRDLRRDLKRVASGWQVVFSRPTRESNSVSSTR